uniref:VWFA domain-containing protein n=1 Tax=Macrostomum lignano TaxID=282301 RepID=A0A1I8GP90_9PLAT
CSAFTSPPYSRATAVVKLDPASPTPAPSGVDYCNQIATLDLRPDPRLFDAETDRNTSTSQVAQFVYHASNEILNAANWTADLEAKMKQNAADDQTVQWQYFCSKQGLMKIYPGVQYLMSETYPKDLVLVIDNSGSMMGSGSIMANRTMTEFFATLTANDYFNVLLAMGTQTTSASYVRYVTDVYNGTLLQATDANKNKMMELFNEDRAKLTASSRNLQAQGLADLGGALTEAFQLLRLVKESKTAVSAGGVQAIALVTDSTPEDYAAVFA